MCYHFRLVGDGIRGISVQRNSDSEEIAMSLMKFWSDLDMWSKYGLAAVGAVVIFAFVAFVLL